MSAVMIQKEQNATRTSKIVCLYLPEFLSGGDDFISRYEKNNEVKIFNERKSEDFFQYISEVNEKREFFKTILINYPRNKMELNSLLAKLDEIGQRFSQIIVFKPENFLLLKDIEEKYLFCLHCKKLLLKNKVLNTILVNKPLLRTILNFQQHNKISR